MISVVAAAVAAAYQPVAVAAAVDAVAFEPFETEVSEHLRMMTGMC